MSEQTGPEEGKQVKFDPGAAHQQTPRLRPIRGFAQKMGEQVRIGIADRSQISQAVVFAPPAAQAILPKMDGSRNLNQIVAELREQGLTREILEQFVAQLDAAGLLFGPKYEAMLATMKDQFDSAEDLPPAITAAMAEGMVVAEVGQEATDEQKESMGPGKLTEALDTWIDRALKDAENPSMDALPKGVVVPQLDYGRAWINFAAIWGRLRVVDRPDHILILGANNFGMATGVCGCDKGFRSPLGTCPLDQELFDAVTGELGPEGTAKFLANRYDHEREHSIELQIPWIQHCLGTGEDGSFCPVLGVLIHDPIANNGRALDGKGLDLEPFIEATQAAIEKLGGKTLVVASASLSHVGPAFGDRQALAGDSPEAEQFRQRVLAADKELIELLSQGKAGEVIASLAWQQNPTRWSCAGPLAAMVRIVSPAEGRVYGYTGAMDPQGMTMVSTTAMAFM
jgi:AmmeMemoRadiSam system protein B